VTSLNTKKEIKEKIVKVDLMKINLWNVDKTNKQKTKNVMEYIDLLEEPEGETQLAIRKFNKLIKIALSKTTPDEMLSAIGYRFNNYPEIYDMCRENDEAKR